MNKKMQFARAHNADHGKIPANKATTGYIVKMGLMTPKEFWAYVAKLLSVD